jgi:DNA polymerase III subunit gamma/tau
MGEPTTYQSLYRRYRPQRFGDVLGQDHVTEALRNAVRDGRVGHAYLFSGPRGTGKTSTARILAKVLNCYAPEDGEPCGVCERCQIVERGQDIDWLLEQDAASKSKVDDMRDLLDRVPLGTSGERKVIILDEVHMLSQGAENALLKTLEEPPAHVVFVLATTDPQKVRPTIRSRTQHFEFHLLSADALADHVRHVIADAELPLSGDAMAEAVDHVVQVGGGSVRDTLSALDQVAALGRVVTAGEPIDAVLDAVAAQDPGAVLVAVAEAVASGREPRALGEALIVRLRQGFLALMGVGDDQIPGSERERARALGERLGASGLTRALEVLGEALTELSRKPDPRVVLEVALVRLTRPDADRSLDALLERIERLERAVAGSATVSGEERRASGEARGASPDAARAALASGRSRQPQAPSTRERASRHDASQQEASGPDGSPAATEPARSPDRGDAAENATPGSPPDLDMLRAAWRDSLLGSLPISVRSKWRGGQWVSCTSKQATFAVPNEWHKQACDAGRVAVEQAVAGHFGTGIGVEVVVEGGPDAGSPSARTASPQSAQHGQAGDNPAAESDTVAGSAADAVTDPADDAVDPAEIADLADAGSAPKGGVDLLVREFGGELITSDALEDDR